MFLLKLTNDLQCRKKPMSNPWHRYHYNDGMLGFIILIGLYILFLVVDIMAIKEFIQLSKEGKLVCNKELKRQKLMPILVVSTILIVFTIVVILIFVLSK